MKFTLGLKRIDRYIIKKFLGTYVFSILLIISVSVMFDFNEKVDYFIKNAAPAKAIIFDYYLNFIPYYANLFSSLFTFISVIFFTSKLADNSEIIAMLSSGINFDRLMRPYMISAFIIYPFLNILRRRQGVCQFFRQEQLVFIFLVLCRTNVYASIKNFAIIEN